MHTIIKGVIVAEHLARAAVVETKTHGGGSRGERVEGAKVRIFANYSPGDAQTMRYFMIAVTLINDARYRVPLYLVILLTSNFAR